MPRSHVLTHVNYQNIIYKYLGKISKIFIYNYFGGQMSHFSFAWWATVQWATVRWATVRWATIRWATVLHSISPNGHYWNYLFCLQHLCNILIQTCEFNWCVIVSSVNTWPWNLWIVQFGIKRDIPVTLGGQYLKTATRYRCPSCRDLKRGSRAFKI